MAFPWPYLEFDPGDPELFIPCNPTATADGRSKGTVQLCAPRANGGDTGRVLVVQPSEQLLKGCPNLEDNSANRPPSPCPPFNSTAFLQPPPIKAIP